MAFSSQALLMASSGRIVNMWDTWNGANDGADAVFTTNAVTNTNIRALSSTTVICTYTDTTNSNFGTAVVGTISGTTITWGTPVVYRSANTNLSYISILSSTKALVSFIDSSDSNKPKAIVLDISGTVITPNSIVTIDNNPGGVLSAWELDSTHVIVGYSGTTPKANAVVLSISGSTITVNTPFQYNAGSTVNDNSIVGVSATQALVVYSDAANSSAGTAQVLDISGTTVTGNTAYVIKTGTITRLRVCQLSSTSYAVAYRSGTTTTTYGQALSLSGTVVSSGTEQTLDASFLANYWVCKADATHAFFFYRNSGATAVLGVVGRVSGTTLTLLTPATVNSVNGTEPGCANISDTQVVVSYRDQSASSHGTGKIIA